MLLKNLMLKKLIKSFYSLRCCYSYPRARNVNSYYNSNDNLEQPDWENIKLEKIRKNLFENAAEQSDLNTLTENEIEEFRRKHSISVSGQNVPAPILNLENCRFSPQIVAEMKRRGFENPTPIQAQSWPIVMGGNNVVGIAQTGSGKTLSYILPAISHIAANNVGGKNQRKPGPNVLVLAPTRELAQQIKRVSEPFVNLSNMRSFCVFGGVSKSQQEYQLRQGVEVVIATPGRLIDLIMGSSLTLQRCTFLVLDEADRMLDMGFEPQIRQIFGQIRPDRQLCMWSATWPAEIRELAEDFLDEYVKINIGSLSLAANHNITQLVDVCEEHDKNAKLIELLKKIFENSKKEKVLIFAETKRKVELLSEFIYENGWRSSSMHGGKSQSQRDNALNKFRDGNLNILVATDVAARGLDVDGIKHVINYDYPQTSKDYIHRIGRTGRSGQSGTSYTFFTKENAGQAADLISVLKEANQDVSDDLRRLLDYKSHSFGFQKKRNNFRSNNYNYRPRNNYSQF